MSQMSPVITKSKHFLQCVPRRLSAIGSSLPDGWQAGAFGGKPAATSRSYCEYDTEKPASEFVSPELNAQIKTDFPL
jgi:hypothetical protein